MMVVRMAFEGEGGKILHIIFKFKYEHDARWFMCAAKNVLSVTVREEATEDGSDEENKE